MRRSTGSQTHLCSARYAGGIKIVQPPKGHFNLPLNGADKLTLAGERSIRRKHTSADPRYRPTVPFVSILADNEPSLFYTMQEKG